MLTELSWPWPEERALDVRDLLPRPWKGFNCSDREAILVLRSVLADAEQERRSGTLGATNVKQCWEDSSFAFGAFVQRHMVTSN